MGTDKKHGKPATSFRQQAQHPCDLSFFDSLYRVTEDEESLRDITEISQSKDKSGHPTDGRINQNPMPSSAQKTNQLLSVRSGRDESFYESGMDTPWLSFDKDYSVAGLKLRSRLKSKFVRYMESYKQATTEMYG